MRGVLCVLLWMALSDSGGDVDLTEVTRYNDLGVAHMEQHNFAAAAREFRRVIELYPDYAIGHFNLGIAYMQMCEYEEAIRELRRALALDPKNPYAHYTLGLIHKVKGEYQEAKRELEAVLKMDPEDPYVWHNLGIVLSKLGDHEGAIKAYKQVLRLDPNNISAHYNLAIELKRVGRAEESRRHMEEFRRLKVLGLNPTAGVRYLEQGKYAEAIPDPSLLKPPPDERLPVRFVDVTGEVRLPSYPVPPEVPEEVPVEATKEWTVEHLVVPSGGNAAWGDYDNDGDLDLYIVRCDPEASANVLLRNDGGRFADVTEEAGVGDRGLGMDAAWGDYDNDGDLDLYVANFGPNVLYRNEGDGTFTDVTQEAGVGDPRWSMSCAFSDVDHDGDLDIFVVNYVDIKARGGPRFPIDFLGERNTLYRNNFNGTFTDATEGAKAADARRSRAVVFTDYDNDRDVDFFVANDGAPDCLYSNNRDGTFTDRAVEAGVASPGRGFSLAIGDYDRDRFMDVVAGSSGEPPVLYRYRGDGKYEPLSLPWPEGFRGSGVVATMDYDNDEDLDILAVSSEGRPVLLRNRMGEGFEVVEDAFPKVRIPGVRKVLVGDWDLDGDPDVTFVSYGGGVKLFRNDGGERNSWLRVRLAGRGSNRQGIGSKVEVKTGALWQKREVRGDSWSAGGVLTFGLGGQTRADLMRILWPGGVRQTELEVPARRDTVLVEVDRKGTSCPMLYVHDGEKVQYVTDFLGAADSGYLIEPGIYAQPDPDEYVPIPKGLLRSVGGIYDLRLTDQLEEVIFLDQVRLLAVDHPPGWEVYPNERFLSSPPYPEFRLYFVRNPLPPRHVWDYRGREVTELVRFRDRRYPEVPLDRFQGYARVHTLTLDLGDLSGAGRILLVAYGWLEYMPSTANVAAWQAGVRAMPPRLEVPDGRGGWTVVTKDMGAPAGEPKPMVLNLTGKFPARDYRLRITTNYQVYWDQILIDTTSSEPPHRLLELPLRKAELRWLGYPYNYSPDGRKPEVYDYHRALLVPRYNWRDITGYYTKYGDVRELLADVDDKFVVMRHGDEVALEFAAPLLPEGWERSFIFYADGFGKSTDLWSAYTATVDPLPFHGMSGYPYGEDESYPNDPEHQEYLERYNTRLIVWERE
ncbi:MAG TPA: tetratricopeptide repeat protein [Candidatus Latescibacteria bacterium]|nr:tetratricopeptide repeat protein [Candidatus Latescibacterota bacterium]